MPPGLDLGLLECTVQRLQLPRHSLEARLTQGIARPLLHLEVTKEDRVWHCKRAACEQRPAGQLHRPEARVQQQAWVVSL